MPRGWVPLKNAEQWGSFGSVGVGEKGGKCVQERELSVADIQPRTVIPGVVQITVNFNNRHDEVRKVVWVYVGGICLKSCFSCIAEEGCSTYVSLMGNVKGGGVLRGGGHARFVVM